MYVKVFYLVLVFPKGCFSLAKLLLISILQWEPNSKISFRQKGNLLLSYWQTWNVNKQQMLLHLCIGELLWVGSQYIDLNSIRVILCILLNLMQNCMHLFFVICSFSFTVLVRFWYETGNALSKYGLMNTLQ